ncbi:MAG TPA: hypothetical protein VNZ05_03530 [Solirubrobacteraceae bacterium]|jgi:hypothetical protein|nr:hypothetical protein [Solirubrobacteraceae bacterium]
MPQLDGQPQALELPSAPQDAPDPFSEAAAHQAPSVGELLGEAENTAREMLAAEDALGLIRERFHGSDDPQARAALAAEALEQVERQMALVHERRRRLDRVEGKLWARQNRLERFLIQARGLAWWHARRAPLRASALGPERT